MTNSYIYFLIFTSYLHSLHILQEGKRVTIDEEKTAVCFGVFLIIEFTFMSKTLYMTVCSKKCPFFSLSVK